MIANKVTDWTLPISINPGIVGGSRITTELLRVSKGAGVFEILSRGETIYQSEVTCATWEDAAKEAMKVWDLIMRDQYEAANGRTTPCI